MRDLIPYIFWPWFGLSCFVLVRRRVSGGTWRAMADPDSLAPIEFPPPPPETLPEPSAVVAPSAQSTGPIEAEAFAPASVAVMTSAYEDTSLGGLGVDRPRSRTLAEAVEGITMPCDLAPLMGTGPLNPREVAFITSGHLPAAVGAALADELERLGYEITPLDDRSILANQGPDGIEARLVSAELTSEEVMRELHPSAPADALVVEMKLT